ncbi:MAG: Smr/MutS family protein, partial [Thermoanaerobaculia bacterium]|nr:Smr/MutS family protein [Thermoanaerobaculia bacterium]
RPAPPRAEALLAEALPDVQPLDRDGPGRVSRRPAVAPPPAPVAPIPRRAGGFHVEWHGERVAGWRGELPPREFDTAGRATIPAAATLDLHGLDREAARERLARFLAESARRGQRTVLVVTGHGRRREGAGVLRREVPRWLSTPPLAARVAAFASAPAAEGGAGALRVLLGPQR